MGVALATLLSLAIPAGGAGLDVRSWIERPGAKLVAVEFYATWCKPCMEAVPRWKALHDKYRKEGLRLVVVATQDPRGGCVNPGWNPDDVVCDDEGFIARSFGAAERLPAAFLWSWQGQLLVEHGEVGEVENAIVSWMRDAPRVAAEVREVAPSAGISAANLESLVRTELDRTNKLSIIASDRERARLDVLRASSFKARFDDAMQCEVGKELSANSLLEARITGAPGRLRLGLMMFSVERGCLTASAIVDWNAKKQRAAIAEAVAELMSKLRSEIRMPGRGSTSPPRETAWNPEGSARSIVTFRSEPAGAVVLVDGGLTCQDTSKPCAKAIAQGTHTVTMEKERYAKRSERVTITADTTLEWKLEPDFATISIEGPPGANVTLDGEPLGALPIAAREVPAGSHELAIADRCYESTKQRVLIARGEQRVVQLEAKAKEGALDVVAQDERGNAVKAEVFADGKRVGSAPGIVRVSVCTNEVVVKNDQLGVFAKKVEITERATRTLEAVLRPEGPAITVPLPAGYTEIAGKVFTYIRDTYHPVDRVRVPEMSRAAIEALRKSGLNVAGESAQPNSLTELAAQIARLIANTGKDKATYELVALDGALSALDRYTTVLSPAQYAEMKTTTKGKFGGLGIVLSKRDGAFVVREAFPNTPAARAGLTRDDQIVRVGEVDVDGMTMEKVVELLRGEPGSSIAVWIRRGAAKPERVPLVREIIRVEQVAGRMLDGGVGYLAIKSFNAETEKDVTKQLDAMKSAKGLILDLRGCPGGLLEQAVKVADLFVASGDLVTTVGRKDRDSKKATPSPSDLSNVPMIVLADPWTSSGAEIVAGSLRNLNRALLFGERTYGKGSVQVLYDLPFGFALKVTVAQYLTAGGNAFADTGLLPDVAVLEDRTKEELDPARAGRDRGEHGTAAVIRYANTQESFDPYPIELAQKVLAKAGRADAKAMLDAARPLLESEARTKH